MKMDCFVKLRRCDEVVHLNDETAVQALKEAHSSSSTVDFFDDRFIEDYSDGNDSIEDYMDDNDSTEDFMYDNDSTEDFMYDNDSTEDFIDDNDCTEVFIDDNDSISDFIDSDSTNDSADENDSTKDSMDENDSTMDFMDDNDSTEDFVDNIENFKDDYDSIEDLMDEDSWKLECEDSKNEEDNRLCEKFNVPSCFVSLGPRVMPGVRYPSAEDAKPRASSTSGNARKVSKIPRLTELRLDMNEEYKPSLPNAKSLGYYRSTETTPRSDFIDIMSSKKADSADNDNIKKNTTLNSHKSFKPFCLDKTTSRTESETIVGNNRHILNSSWLSKPRKSRKRNIGYIQNDPLYDNFWRDLYNVKVCFVKLKRCDDFKCRSLVAKENKAISSNSNDCEDLDVTYLSTDCDYVTNKGTKRKKEEEISRIIEGKETRQINITNDMSKSHPITVDKSLFHTESVIPPETCEGFSLNIECKSSRISERVKVVRDESNVATSMDESYRSESVISPGTSEGSSLNIESKGISEPIMKVGGGNNVAINMDGSLFCSESAITPKTSEGSSLNIESKGISEPIMKVGGGNNVAINKSQTAEDCPLNIGSNRITVPMMGVGVESNVASSLDELLVRSESAMPPENEKDCSVEMEQMTGIEDGKNSVAETDGRDGVTCEGASCDEKPGSSHKSRKLDETIVSLDDINDPKNVGREQSLDGISYCESLGSGSKKLRHCKALRKISDAIRRANGREANQPHILHCPHCGNLTQIDPSVKKCLFCLKPLVVQKGTDEFTGMDEVSDTTHQLSEETTKNLPRQITPKTIDQSPELPELPEIDIFKLNKNKKGFAEDFCESNLQHNSSSQHVHQDHKGNPFADTKTSTWHNAAAQKVLQKNVISSNTQVQQWTSANPVLPNMITGLNKVDAKMPQHVENMNVVSRSEQILALESQSRQTSTISQIQNAISIQTTSTTVPATSSLSNVPFTQTSIGICEPFRDGTSWHPIRPLLPAPMTIILRPIGQPQISHSQLFCTPPLSMAPVNQIHQSNQNSHSVNAVPMATISHIKKPYNNFETVSAPPLLTTVASSSPLLATLLEGITTQPFQIDTQERMSTSSEADIEDCISLKHSSQDWPPRGQNYRNKDTILQQFRPHPRQISQLVSNNPNKQHATPQILHDAPEAGIKSSQQKGRQIKRPISYNTLPVEVHPDHKRNVHRVNPLIHRFPSMHQMNSSDPPTFYQHMTPMNACTANLSSKQILKNAYNMSQAPSFSQIGRQYIHLKNISSVPSNSTNINKISVSRQPSNNLVTRFPSPVTLCNRPNICPTVSPLSSNFQKQKISRLPPFLDECQQKFIHPSYSANEQVPNDQHSVQNSSYTINSKQPYARVDGLENNAIISPQAPPVESHPLINESNLSLNSSQSEQVRSRHQGSNNPDVRNLEDMTNLMEKSDSELLSEIRMLSEYFLS